MQDTPIEGEEVKLGRRVVEEFKEIMERKRKILAQANSQKIEQQNIGDENQQLPEIKPLIQIKVLSQAINLISSSQSQPEQQQQSSSLSAQNRQNDKLRLFDLSLIDLIRLFLSELTQKFIIRSSSNQFAMLAHKFQNHPINEDQFILMHNLGRLQPTAFYNQVVTPYEHRALATILKKLRPSKYSTSPCHCKQSAGSFRQSFYLRQYELSFPQYYKQLLGYEIRYERFKIPEIEVEEEMKGITRERIKSNGVRKLLGRIFKNKLMADHSKYEEIIELQNYIKTESSTVKILKKMRETKKSQPSMCGLSCKEEPVQKANSELADSENDQLEANTEQAKMNIYKGYRGYKSKRRQMKIKKISKGYTQTAVELARERAIRKQSN